MEVGIVNIGNSKGIRIPKAVLEQLGIVDKVEMSIKKDSILLTPLTPSPREGWDAAFKKMAENGDDTLLDGYTSSSFDEDEWQW